MARPIKLPPRAEIVRRLTGQRDLLRAKGNEAGASAIQRMIDAPITREWPEDGGTVANPADKAPKGCGHTGNPGDVCSDCSFTPSLALRLTEEDAETFRRMNARGQFEPSTVKALNGLFPMLNLAPRIKR